MIKPAHFCLALMATVLVADSSASAQYNPGTGGILTNPGPVITPADWAAQSAALPAMHGNYNLERDFGLCIFLPQARQSGLVVSQVYEGSHAHYLNFRSGDIVLSVNHHKLTHKQQLAAALGFHLEQPVLVDMQRGTQVYHIAIKPDQIRAVLVRNSMSRPMW